MKMIVENDIGIEVQPFLLSAEGEGARDDVQISGASEHGQPAHNGAGNEMRGI